MLGYKLSWEREIITYVFLEIITYVFNVYFFKDKGTNA